MYVPHAMQLANGITNIALLLNAILALLMVPMIVVLSTRLGPLGGAIAWLVLHLLYFVLGTFLMHQRLFVGRGWRWVLADVAPPALIATVFASLGATCLPFLEGGLLRLGLGILLGIASVVTSLFSLPVLGPEVRRVMSRRFAGVSR
jgi:hypothetical protein